MNNDSKWVFIINPAAGGGYAATIDGLIKQMAEKHGITAETVFTGKKGDATDLSASFATEGYKYIIGVGGDGTFNEVATPLVGNPEVITGLVPAGTGNDFVQLLGFSGRLTPEGWDTFFKADTVAIDSGWCNGKYFFNGMGLGFDAQVAAENYTAPGEVKKGGKNKYIWHILKTLLFYREKKMTVRYNSLTSETDCFINTVASGRRFAGAFFLTPDAIANDGLLDVCMVRKLSLPERLKILMMVPKGTHIKDKRVNYYTTAELDIEFSERVPFHLDGELDFAKRFDIKTVPVSLNVIFNRAGNHFLNI